MSKLIARLSRLLVPFLLWPLLSLAQNPPPRPDRLYVSELEGIWVNAKYLEALSRSRMPHEAARKVQPVVIGIQRQGRSFPIVVTNFDKAAVQAVIDVEPGGKPDLYRLVLGPEDRPISSSEVQYIWIRGSRNPEGKFDRLEMAEPTLMKGKWAEFLFFDKELAPRLNRAVLAGKYKDTKGQSWEFSDAGEAYWPDGTFSYEISFNDPRAACEYLETEDPKAVDGARQRYGFGWRQGKLLLYRAALTDKRVKCDAAPFATLSPQ
jgi:hypothetical protein